MNHPEGENYAELYNKLRETYAKVIDEEEKLRLLKILRSKGLFTRDILSFIKNQTVLRSHDKELDLLTARRAMNTKIKDVTRTLNSKRESVATIRGDFLKKLNGEKYTLRKIMKKIKKELLDKGVRQKKRQIHDSKISHLQSIIEPLIRDQTHKPSFRPSNVPDRLQEYAGALIFKSPSEMPPPEIPVGPYICKSDIKLSDAELSILSKDPKYSLMTHCSLNEFKLESERMLSKQRYGQQDNIYKKKRDDGLNIVPVSHSLGYQKKETGNDHNKQDVLLDLWKKEKHRFIYNPFTTSIDFTGRRPTDYKLNSRVILPKPLDAENEYLCEFRRRTYLDVYNNYIKDCQTHSNENKRSKHSGQGLNVGLSDGNKRKKQIRKKKLLKTSTSWRLKGWKV